MPQGSVIFRWSKEEGSFGCNFQPRGTDFHCFVQRALAFEDCENSTNRVAVKELN